MLQQNLPVWNGFSLHFAVILSGAPTVITRIQQHNLRWKCSITRTIIVKELHRNYLWLDPQSSSLLWFSSMQIPSHNRPRQLHSAFLPITMRSHPTIRRYIKQAVKEGSLNSKNRKINYFLCFVCSVKPLLCVYLYLQVLHLAFDSIWLFCDQEASAVRTNWEKCSSFPSNPSDHVDVCKVHKSWSSWQTSGM